MTDRPTIAIATPVLNEDAVVPELCARLAAVLDAHPDCRWRTRLERVAEWRQGAEVVRAVRRLPIEPHTGMCTRRSRARRSEVGIGYYGRTNAGGKKIGWRDGFRALWAIFKYNLLR